MKTLVTAAMLLFTTGCVVHAHPGPASSAYNGSRPTVRAWVWVPGHYRQHRGWQHGHWELRRVERYLLSRRPRTHIRYVEGRRRPTARPRTRPRRR